MHQRAPSYDDGESLQADVMRFMAIIAFCLIAILALVKHAEPPQTPTETTAEATTPSEPVRQESVQPEPVRPERVHPERVHPEPVIAPELTPSDPEPVALAASPPAPAPETEPEPIPAAAAAPIETPAPSPAIDAAPAPAAEPEEEGLILRFASDGDFLRLIARGDIRVYAFQDSDVLTLSETYRFLDTESPGQVYELLPPSIPGLVVDALKQARPSIDGYRWGIALPGRISNQIERHLGQVTQGQLVIDRYGDVRHVAAS